MTASFGSNWGSGATGRYPGSAWTTGAGGLPYFQPALPAVRVLSNAESYTLTSDVAATAIQPLEVTADIVAVVAPPTSSGRVSLGHGADVTLAAASGERYCTAAGCRCPDGSTPFTPMTAGLQYLTVTGGTDPDQ